VNLGGFLGVELVDEKGYENGEKVRKDGGEHESV